jgi:hypothetical protein
MPELPKMLNDDLFDLITKFPTHSFKKIEGSITPFSHNQSYVCLLNNKWVIDRQFTGLSPVVNVVNTFYTIRNEKMYI